MEAEAEAEAVEAALKSTASTSLLITYQFFCRRWFQLFDDLNFFYTLELLSSVRSVVFVYPV